MIGQLRGIILEKHPPQLLINVQGVGYEVDAPMNTFYHLPDIGQEVILHTHFVVREDAQQLYGFFHKEERTLFRTLLKVNGVGPKLALTILSSISAEEFVDSVMNHDTTRLVRIPGVGKKTAERLIIEIKDKLADWHKNNVDIKPSLTLDNSRQQMLQDAIAALIALGFKREEAKSMITKMDDGQMKSEELIRRALQEMVV